MKLREYILNADKVEYPANCDNVILTTLIVDDDTMEPIVGGFAVRGVYYPGDGQPQDFIALVKHKTNMGRAVVHVKLASAPSPTLTAAMPTI